MYQGLTAWSLDERAIERRDMEGTYDMDAVLAISVGRVLERILITLFAGASLYLGYRLFASSTTQAGAAEFKQGSIAFKLKNIGQGVFFALFGSFILTVALYRPMTTTSPSSANSMAQPEASRDSASFSYFGPGGNSQSGPDDVVRATTTLDRYFRPESQRQPEDRNEETARLAVELLMALRQPILDRKFGKGSFADYQRLRAMKSNPTVFDAELRRTGKSRWYSDVEDYLSTPLR